MRDNGGPAFPLPMDSADRKALGYPDGMTLRDYFAAKAMQSLIAANSTSGELRVQREDGVVEIHQGRKIVPMLAYVYADAMLAERSRG